MEWCGFGQKSSYGNVSAGSKVFLKQDILFGINVRDLLVRSTTNSKSKIQKAKMDLWATSKG